MPRARARAKKVHSTRAFREYEKYENTGERYVSQSSKRERARDRRHDVIP